MKVLITTPHYPPESGGPAIEAVTLEKELPKHGIEPTVYPFSHVRGLPTGLRHLVYLLNLIWKARGQEAIIAIDTFSVCLPSAIGSRILGKPLVVRVPGQFSWEQAVQRYGITDSIEDFQDKKYGFRVELLRAIERWAVSSAKLVVVPSDFFGKIVAKWGIPKKRIKRVYLGTEFESVLPELIPHEGKVIVTSGRLVPWKGYGALIDVLEKLPPHWHLEILGDGPEKSRLEGKVKQMSLSNRVKFAGALKRHEVLKRLRNADVFVLNTSFESFSFQILEAMWCGVPVVTTNAGSIPELIQDGKEGLLCEPNNVECFVSAIRSIEEESDLWKARIEAAQKKASQFSAEESVNEFTKLLKEICA